MLVYAIAARDPHYTDPAIINCNTLMRYRIQMLISGRPLTRFADADLAGIL